MGQSVCPRCQGTGKVVADHVQTCGICGGTGQLPDAVASAYETGRRVGRMLGAAEVRKAVEAALNQRHCVECGRPDGEGHERACASRGVARYA